VDAIPAMDCRKFVVVSRSSTKGAKKIQPSWLSQWIASWVFYVDNLQQLMDVKADDKTERRFIALSI